MDAEVARRARDELVRGPAGREGVFTRNGHDIIEMAVINTNKGSALEEIRSQVGASAVVFFGDDVTDEDGFRTLQGPDIGIRVGDGPSIAQYRVADTDVVAQLLALLSEFRAKWLRGAGLVPIEDHSVLSDLRTAAIVSPAARITWLCTPRIDSAAVFAELLGGPAAGHFSVSDATGAGPVSQRYRAGTMVLQTQFPGFNVLDYFDTSSGRTRRLAGRSDLIRVIEGSGRAPDRVRPPPRLRSGADPARTARRGHHRARHLGSDGAPLPRGELGDRGRRAERVGGGGGRARPRTRWCSSCGPAPAPCGPTPEPRSTGGSTVSASGRTGWASSTSPTWSGSWWPAAPWC